VRLIDDAGKVLADGTARACLAALLAELSNDDLGKLKLTWIGQEQSRRVAKDDRPAPGPVGSQAVKRIRK
jgi:uncharacterized protein YidB (DUF937 family)